MKISYRDNLPSEDIIGFLLETIFYLAHQAEETKHLFDWSVESKKCFNMLENSFLFVL
jgi:hypothetical protein